MRTRREPKPACRPRIVTARLVVVALVIGGVLAVVSVPASVAITSQRWMLDQGRETEQRVVFEGRVITIFRLRYPLARVWTYHNADVGSAESPPPVPLLQDPRPRHARVFLDAYGGSSISYRVGWPLECAYGYVNSPESDAPDTLVGLWRVRAFGRDLTIPTLPLWPGLLGNTLFYAMLALTPLALLRWRRQRRRARRGLCVACGYELGEGVSACPECGLANVV